MDTRIRNVIFILVITGALAGVLFVRSRHVVPLQPVVTSTDEAVVTGGTLPITVTIADTPATREQGLSDTLSLPQNTGKLFVFERPGRYGFWMKDMHYALDLVWIDADFRIIDVTSNVTPDTYPQVFYPPTDTAVLYVLEINANQASTLGLAIGTKLSLEK